MQKNAKMVGHKPENKVGAVLGEKYAKLVARGEEQDKERKLAGGGETDRRKWDWKTRQSGLEKEGQNRDKKKTRKTQEVTLTTEHHNEVWGGARATNRLEGGKKISSKTWEVCNCQLLLIQSQKSGMEWPRDTINGEREGDYLRKKKHPTTHGLSGAALKGRNKNLEQLL